MAQETSLNLVKSNNRQQWHKPKKKVRLKMTALFVILSPIFSQCLESKVNSMRTSQYLFSTLKETPAEAAIVSHQLMLRAG